MDNNQAKRVRPVRQVDIARELGVDRVTVTRALQNDPAVSPITRKAVREMADKLGYVPDAIGRTLATGYHPVIALVMVGGFYFGIDGIAQALDGTRWSTQLILTSHQPEQQREMVRRLLANRIAGVIYRPWFSTSSQQVEGVELLRKQHLPIVVEGMTTKIPDVTQVTFDFYQGLLEGLYYLKAQGHTHIGLAHHTLPMWPQMFMKAAATAGVTAVTKFLPCEESSELATLLDGEWSGANRPTALMLSSLPLSIQFDRYRWDRHLRIPDDLAVMMIQFHTIWIPHIHEEYPFLVFDDTVTARRAAEVLLEMLDSPGERPTETILMPGRLRLPASPCM